MISLIVAMDQNNLIGQDNDLPWKLPADLAYFKKITMGKSIVMGRKTYNSIGRPLPGRHNIVLTKTHDMNVFGCEVMHSVDEVLHHSEQLGNEVFIIGGAEIFNQFLPFTDKLYITHIEERFSGDTYFPKVNMEEWELISREKGPKDNKNPYDYFFAVYRKK
ncbi:dihydrofolate reductase [Bacillus timonensis]|nr:dihydrofolate reductase [Bacillus timonensis]